MKTPKEVHTQCLVIGSGIAGLSAAIALSEQGIKTLLISAASDFTESNTRYAQGGIIFKETQENKKALIEDILEAGSYANYLPAVEQLAELGPEVVRKVLIEKARVPFDRLEDGSYCLTREGGHSKSRILHRGDETGFSIEGALMEYCTAQPHLGFLPKTTAVNLLMTSFHSKDRSKLHDEASCFGVFAFDQESSEVYPIFAEHTVLATGGLGQVYLHNTNSKFSRGDGIALAYRAGCRLENLEFVQFHPTTFFKEGSPRFLITEALRGEGAVVLNEKGERFLSKYLKNYSTPELAPRDKVAKAIHQEMLSTGASCVYLNISHKPKEWIEERFPFVYGTCLKHGIDITKNPIPVVPGAHYHCGGIWSDLSGRTSVKGVWAVGEVSSTGVHGANRLASTSLLEGLVWGTRAGESIAKEIQEKPMEKFPEIQAWQSEKTEVDPAFLSQDWLTLKHTMWNYVGLIKTDARLKRAQGILTELSRGIDVFYRKAKLSDELIGLRNASTVALLVLEAALRNTKSLGCYLREDLEI